MPRTLPWEALSQGMMAFLVTRQIFCGAGKFGWEEEDNSCSRVSRSPSAATFSSSCKALTPCSGGRSSTPGTSRMPTTQLYRRFHVIIGDANLSLFATYLKIGTTALVLQALLNGAPLERIPHLADPLQALKSISRDPDLAMALPDGCTAGKPTPIDVQRTYLATGPGVLPGLAPEWHGPGQRRGKRCLNDLERDPLLHRRPARLVGQIQAHRAIPRSGKPRRGRSLAAQP